MKQAGGETLYLKVDRNVQVHDKKITIGDLAQILCTDKQTENLVKTIKVPQATNGKPGRHTMSVMELIERIQEEVSGLEINNIGEYDFLVTYEAEKQPGRVLSYAKTIFVAALSFFGAAFYFLFPFFTEFFLFWAQSYVFSPERTKKIYYRKHHGQTEIPTSLPARYICNDYNYPYYTSSLAFLPLDSQILDTPPANQ